MRQHTRDGSVNHKLAMLVKNTNVALGRGITSAEIREGWAATHGVPLPDRLQTRIYDLAARRIIVATEGLWNAQRYAHRDAPQVPLGDTDPDGEAVLAVLERLHRGACDQCPARQADVLTHAVAVELKRLGKPELARGALRVLTRLSTVEPRGARAGVPATVMRTSERSPSGHLTNWWRPAGAPAPAPAVAPRPRSTRDATVGAVLATERALARPAAANEVTLWCRANASTSAVAQMTNAERLMYYVNTALRAAPTRSPPPIKRVVGPLTCEGGAPCRFAAADRDAHVTGDTSAAPSGAVYACRIADAIYAFRPVDELRNLRALEHLAAEFDSPPLRQLCERRRSMLQAAIMSQVPLEEIEAGVALYRSSLATLQEWSHADHTAGKGRRWVWKCRIAHGVDGCRAVLRARHAQANGGGGDALRVGQAALISLSALDDALGELRSRNKQGASVTPTLVGNARRFGAPRATGAQHDVARPFAPVTALIDRVDAFLAIFESMYLPAAAVLLGGALDVMGYVLRDADVLRDLLTAVRPGDASVRRSIVVALGLLGEPVGADVALDDARDPAGFDAYVLAASLCGIEAGVAAANTAYRLAGSAAASAAADSALARLEAGDVFGVIG